MLTIRQQQIDAFRPVLFDRLVHRMLADVRQEVPAALPVLDEAWVRRALLLAQSHGVVREDDLRDFLGLNALHGEGFLARAEHGWMLATLRDALVPDAHQRMRRLHAAALRRLRQQEDNRQARARFEAACPRAGGLP